MKKNITKKGFGIIEVLIASTILIMFLATGIVLINASYKNVVVGKHRMQASLLASQAINEVRATRDTAYFQGAPFPIGGSFALTGSPCTPVTTTYSDDLITPGTFFTKEVCVENYNPGVAGRKFIVTVSWPDYGQEHTITQYTYLLDWQGS